MRRRRGYSRDAEDVRGRSRAGLSSRETAQRSPAVSRRRGHRYRRGAAHRVRCQSRAADGQWPVSWGGRDVTRGALRASPKEVFFHLLGEIIARFLVGQIEAVLVDQHFLMLEPLL